jgi:uncharacterized protein with von Willebrand factor type A (vWA) domain
VSDREVLEKKDFAQMSAAEIAEAKQAIAKLVLPLDEVKTRRLKPSRHGHMIDLRRTLRSSIASRFSRSLTSKARTRMPPR